MPRSSLPPSAQLKLDLMFEGVRYSDALGEAAKTAFPNFFPYRFQKGEHDPTGTGKATIPYMMTTVDGTHVRIKGNAASKWMIGGASEQGFTLQYDDNKQVYPVSFEPLPHWMSGTTDDGYAMAQAGVSVHGDMAVINVAPGCDYFLADKQDGRSMRCSFCAYGAPDARSEKLGQKAGVVSLPELTYRHMQETLRAVVDECAIHHIYLVGGSMTNWYDEGARYLEFAARVKQIVGDAIPVTCGSGALPNECLQQLYDDNLVDSVCFNLEVWSEPLFAEICPGKHRFVGYQQWLASLEQAVALWGRGRVYSAMVAGVELEPEHGLSWEQAAEIALQGAEDLCRRGIIPVYSLYWPPPGRDHPEQLANLRAYFERLNLGYAELRHRHEINIWDGFMCHRCGYMQIECDIDRLSGNNIDE